MLVLHNKIFKNVIGGTEIHVEHLVANLRKQFCVYVVSGNKADRAYVQEFIDDYEFEYFFPIKYSPKTVSNTLWKELFDLIIDVFAIFAAFCLKIFIRHILFRTWLLRALWRSAFRQCWHIDAGFRQRPIQFLAPMSNIA